MIGSQSAIRFALLAAAAAFSAGADRADAQFYTYSSFYGPTTYSVGYAPVSYGSFYGPTYGYGLFPGAAYRQSLRIQRRAFRRSLWYGSPYTSYYGGFGSSCCGVSDCCSSCGVTANFAPTCGCDPCGFNACATGNCGSACSSGSDVIVNSVPSDVDEKQPTPVRPQNGIDKPLETFEKPNTTTPPANGSSNTRPTDGFRAAPGGTTPADPTPFTTPRGGSPLVDPLPDSLNDPLPSGPSSGSPGSGFDSFTPGGGGTEFDSFKNPGAADDSAALPTLPTVRVARSRIQVSARYRIPQMVARNTAIESISIPEGAQIASVD